MAILEIKQEGDPILRKKAQPVRKVNAGVRTLLDDMVETMHSAPGVGLAAPQVGIGKRIIVVDPGEARGGLFQVVNPEITWHSDELDRGTEGCLSIAGWLGDVDRWTKVRVKGLDRQGHDVYIEAEGYLARVFQHEIDHLDGVLYTDKCVNLREIVPEDDEAELGQGEQAAPAEAAPVEGAPAEGES